MFPLCLLCFSSASPLLLLCVSSVSPMFLLCLSSASLLSLFCVSSVSLFVDPLFLLCVSSASLLFLSWFPSVYPMFLYCLSSVSPLLILWFFSAAILFLLYFRSNVFSSPKVVDGERAAGLGLIVGQWTAPKGAMKDDCNFRAYPDFPPGPISPPMGRFPPPQPFFSVQSCQVSGVSAS